MNIRRATAVALLLLTLAMPLVLYVIHKDSFGGVSSLIVLEFFFCLLIWRGWKEAKSETGETK